MADDESHGSGGIRRVVTAHNEHGRSKALDDIVPGLAFRQMPGVVFHELWGADQVPVLPTSFEVPPMWGYYPPAGGFRFGMLTIPGARPRSQDDPPTSTENIEDALPNVLDYMEATAPGMHTTPTIDCIVVLAGACELELDDGNLVPLASGETLVQNGTRHRWRNPHPEPCTMAIFMIGTEHDGAGQPPERPL